MPVGCVNAVAGLRARNVPGLRQQSGGLLVFWSVLYIALRRVLELVLLGRPHQLPRGGATHQPRVHNLRGQDT
jgi:hypothetical protein